jgi:hypothetical protein
MFPLIRRNDCRDWFVMLVITAAFNAGTVWIFIHPSNEAFIAWCGLVATMGGIYHWLNVRDSKAPDACGVAPQ